MVGNLYTLGWCGHLLLLIKLGIILKRLSVNHFMWLCVGVALLIISCNCGR